MSLISMLALFFAQASSDPGAALFDAIRRGDAVRVRSILADDPAAGRARNADGATAALWAAYTRHPELAGIVLGTREPDFFEACALGRQDRATALLHADPALAKAHSADGFSGLGLAIFFGHEGIARMLVDAGADVNARSRNSIHVYPLHSAVAAGNLPMVELLLAHGAQPDCVEFLGATPLHTAAAEGKLAIVEKLLAAGADRRRKTKDSKTAYDLAVEKGHGALAERLRVDLK
jgi:ankyrin repeat protein